MRRHLGPLVLAAVVAGGTFGSGPAARAANTAPNDACSQALTYEKTAAQDSASAQARYDAAVAGLAANQRCSDAEMKLVNEAYLLSMRAPAEHDLRVGNWQRDFERANMLLLQCTNWPGIRGSTTAANCSTQLKYNGITEKALSAVPAPAPSPAGSPAPGTASPAPASSAAPVPRLGPAMPPPAPPRPSISPVPTR